MPWSHKRGKHGACNGKGCENCEKGKVTESPYLPVFMFKNGSLEGIDYTEPCTEILFAATVRSEAQTPVEIEPCEFLFEEEKIEPKKDGDVVLHSFELEARLATFIKSNFKGQEKCELTKIIKHEKSHSCGTTSRYCENVNREHTSNHIWFSIYKGIITQRCFDEECKDFSSRAHLLSPSILKLLYPDSNVLSFVGTGIVTHIQGAKSTKRLSKRIQA
jgi:hypothetical protein